MHLASLGTSSCLKATLPSILGAITKPKTLNLIISSLNLSILIAIKKHYYITTPKLDSFAYIYFLLSFGKIAPSYETRLKMHF